MSFPSHGMQFMSQQCSCDGSDVQMTACDFLSAFVSNAEDEEFPGRLILAASVNEAVAVLLPLVIFSDEEIEALGVR